MTRITRMILVLGKSALSVPDTRFSRVSGSTLVFNPLEANFLRHVLQIGDPSSSMMPWSFFVYPKQSKTADFRRFFGGNSVSLLGGSAIVNPVCVRNGSL